MKIRVVLAEDSEKLSELISLRLTETPDITVTFRAYDGREVLSYLEKKHREVDVVLIGTQIPFMSGFETALKIHQLYTDIKIIVMIIYEGHTWIKKCFESGAHGCFAKSDSLESLIEGIRAVYRGEVYLSEQVRRVAGDSTSA